MLKLGLTCTRRVTGSSERPGSWLSQRLESQECCSRGCCESSQTPMDFRISQPLLHLRTLFLPPEMAPDLQETLESSYLLADVESWMLCLVL